MNAVLGLSPTATGQYPLVRSNVVMYVALPTRSMRSSTRDMAGVYLGGVGGHFPPPLELFSPPLEFPDIADAAKLQTALPPLFFTYSKFAPLWKKSCIQPCMGYFSIWHSVACNLRRGEDFCLSSEQALLGMPNHLWMVQ